MARDPRLSYLASALLVGALFLPVLGWAALGAGSLLLYAELARNVLEVAVKGLSYAAARRVAAGETSEYTYGQGKLEHLVGLFVAAAMLVSVGFIAQHAVLRLITPHALGAVGPGAVIALLMTGTNTFFWRRGRALAQASGSPLLDSKWRMYRGRTLASALVVASLGLAATFQGHGWAQWVDPAACFALCGFILKSAHAVVRGSLSGLLDKSLDESLQLLIIRELTLNFNEYESIHGIRNRRSGRDVFIEIFLEFAPERTMGEVQAAIDAMRAGLERAIPGARVTIVPATERVN